MVEKKKRFMLFNTQREGKGVDKSDLNLPPNLKKFWRIYRENFFGRLLSINLMMIIGNFPVIFLLMAALGVGKASFTMPVGDMFGIINGVNVLQEGFSPASLAMIGIAGTQVVQRATTAWTYVFWALGALTLFTWGVVTAGTTYILRNMVMGRPIFLFSDFFDTIRSNWKQALPYGIIDVGILALIVSNIYFMLRSTGGFLTSFLFWVNVVLFLIYFVMRWYVYLQMVSFDMKLWKIIKNAAYFVLLGIKRNLLALLGILLLIALTLVFLFCFNGYLIVIALFIPAMMLFSNGSLMAVYAAWFKIDQIMVIHEDDEDAPNTNEDVQITEEVPTE